MIILQYNRVNIVYKSFFFGQITALLEYYRTKDEFQSRVKKLVDAENLPFLLILYDGEKEE